MSDLATQQDQLDIFRRYVLINLKYWQDYLATRLADTASLDQGHNRIIKALSFGFELEEAWPFVRDLIEAFSPYMERRGSWEVWRWVLSQAFAAARRSGDTSGEIIISALLARLLQRQSHFKQAILYYRAAIRAARRIGDRYNEARACSNLGFLCSEQGHMWRAEALCCRALATFKQLESRHGQAHTHNHLGSLYTRQGRWELGQKHFERACDLWQTMGDEHGLMRGLNNLGALYNEMGLPDEALSCFERALRQARLTGEETEIARIYTNMGVSYRLKREPIQAENYARQAEAIFQRISNSMGLAEVWGNLGLACLDQGKWQEAVSHLQASLTMWRNQKNERAEIKTLLYLVEYEGLRGDPQVGVSRLEQVERLLKQYDPGKQNHDLQSLFLKCRRILYG
jgi:tetratricopeptide (TPR) repeat protein